MRCSRRCASSTAAETLLIAFDQVGVALRAEGDFKGALQANEALVAKYPRKAVHRLRNASALLEAGLGTRAQREALAATKLEPKSALAWKTLGWMLQHDAVGPPFRRGLRPRRRDRRVPQGARARSAQRRHRRGSRGAARARCAMACVIQPTANLDEAIAEYQARRAAAERRRTRSPTTTPTISTTRCCTRSVTTSCARRCASSPRVSRNAR